MATRKTDLDERLIQFANSVLDTLDVQAGTQLVFGRKLDLTDAGALSLIRGSASDLALR